jgi:hypothetical protein
MGDDDREVRAMALSMFPCPPLPIVGIRGSKDDGRPTETEFSSHDVIAQFMQLSMRMCTHKQNEHRRLVQMDVLNKYISQMECCMSSASTKVCDVSAAYNAMCEYTRSHILSYVHWDGPSNLDIKFLPYTRICIGDTVHTRTVDHVRGQAHLYKNVLDPSDLPQSNWDYPSLLTEYVINIYNSKV